MTAKEEKAWIEGNKAAYRSILGEAVRHLEQEGTAEAWRLERHDTIVALRALCEDHGDNDWPDNLHLADIVNKHLAKHLS